MKTTEVRTESAPQYIASALSAEESAIIVQAQAILSNHLRKNGPAFTSPDLVCTYLRTRFFGLEHEEFHIIYLDNQHRLLQTEKMFRGTIDGASVYPREVAKAALRWNAAALIFVHNHPSGVCEPSQADRNITQKLKDALALFDIKVLDHFIVGDEVYSFAEHGLI